MSEQKPAGGSQQDLGARALEIAKRRQDAAKEVMALLEGRFGPHPSHPETVLYAASWLAGTSLYRSMGISPDVEPGTPVLSTKANEEGPKLLIVFSKLLAQFGIVINQSDLILKVPPEHQSQVGILEIQQQLQSGYNQIMKKHQFDYMEGAKTGAVVCALLVKALCSGTGTFPLGLAAGIVSMGFVEGSKTAPAPLAS